MQTLAAVVRGTLIEAVQSSQLVGVNRLLQNFLDQVVDEFIRDRRHMEVLEGPARRQDCIRSQPEPSSPPVIAATVRIEEADLAAVIFGKHEVTCTGFMLNRLEYASAATVRSLSQQGGHARHIRRTGHEVHV